MKKLVPVGLCLLLLYHTLGHLFVLLSVRVQEQHELSERLRLFSSTDSMVEFHIPLHEHPNEAILTHRPAEGFTYRGEYFEIVNLAVSGDTLHITGYEGTDPTVWKQDLLSLIHTQFGQPMGAGKKTADLLKQLGKDYYSLARVRTWFFLYTWPERQVIASASEPLLTRAQPVHSPPPQV